MADAITADVASPQLFHFSHEDDIQRFEPRPVAVPSKRVDGMDWLNGPLVWAIDSDHAFLYLFPRDCPRILVWDGPGSTAEDRAKWLGGSRIVAFIETGWTEALSGAAIVRYEFATTGFVALEDAGMWVSREPAEVIGHVRIDNLPNALAMAGVAVKAVDSLAPLRPLWTSSLQVSGIRLRNARGWNS